jgi:hypothetical protein
MLPRTLDDIPYKWHKIEKDQGETFSWDTLKQKIIKYFEFRPEEVCLVKGVQDI